MFGTNRDLLRRSRACHVLAASAELTCGCCCSYYIVPRVVGHNPQHMRSIRVDVTTRKRVYGPILAVMAGLTPPSVCDRSFVSCFRWKDIPCSKDPCYFQPSSPYRTFQCPPVYGRRNTNAECLCAAWPSIAYMPLHSPRQRAHDLTCRAH